MQYLTYAGLIVFLLSSAVFATETEKKAAAVQPEISHVPIEKTVVKIPLEEGISIDEAIESMILRANLLNMKKVAHQPLSKELESLGEQNVQRTDIFQFCDVKIAQKLLAYNVDFVAHMPCRIALIEDKNKQAWLVMTNLSLFLADPTLPEDLRQLGTGVRDKLLEIMRAGASGEL